MTTNKSYHVYWIVSGNSSYIGATVDLKKRLRQHCSIIKGGAKRTRGKLWHYHCVISGFQTWRQCLQFEWAAKYYSRHCRGIQSRRLAIEALMCRERWTSNSPLAVDVPLTIEYEPLQYGIPPNELPLASKSLKKTTSKKTSHKKKFKKNLHGVRY